MKISRFVHFLPDNMVFSSLGLGYGRVTEEGRRILRSIAETGCVPDDADPEVVREMRRGAILVPSELDEVAMLKVLANRARFDRRQLSLTIAPTLECNFACVYCYETPKPGRMSEDVIQAVLEFTRHRLPETAHLTVAWYGGGLRLRRCSTCNLNSNYWHVKPTYNLGQR